MLHNKAILFVLSIVTLLLAGLLWPLPSAPRNPAPYIINKVNPGTVSRPAYFIHNPTDDTFYGYGSRLHITAHGDGLTLRNQQADLTLHFVGAAPERQLLGEAQLQATAHRYLGNDTARWQKNMALYEHIRYEALYPGVTLTYHIVEGNLKSEFTLEPGVPLDTIAIECADCTFALDHDGTLRITDAQGAQLREQIPLAYQLIDGHHVEVGIAFRLLSERRYGFMALTPLDLDAPLVIDPLLLYASYLGGSEKDEGLAVAVDNIGNTYVVGITESPDFPLVSPPQHLPGEQKDVFIARFGPDGDLIYTTVIGGSNSERGNCITTDRYGNVYIAGQTFSPDFPTLNGWQPEFGGDEDAYVIKLNPDGTLAYATFIGGTESEEINSILVDSRGYVYVGGEVYSEDYPLLNPWQDTTYGEEDEDAFISIFDPAGQLVYSTYIGGSERDQIFAMALGPDGHIYATGMTSSPDFPVVNPLQPEYGGDWDDCFVLRFDPWRNEMHYATFLGGIGREECWGIVVAPDGSAIIAGNTKSPNFPVVNPIQEEHAGGGRDAIVARLTPDGQALTFSTFLGGSGSDQAWGLAQDSGGNLYVVGETASEDFPTLNALQPEYGGGEYDGFLAHLRPDGTLNYASYLGGSGMDRIWDVTVDEHWVVHLTGVTFSSDLPMVNPAQSERAGYTDALIARFSIVPTPTPTPSPTPTPVPSAATTMGPEGGTLTLTYPGHTTRLDVVSNTLSGATYVTLTYQLDPKAGPLQGIYHAFNLSIAPTDGSTLTQPISPTLELYLTYERLYGVISGTQQLYRLSAGDWITTEINILEQTYGYVHARTPYTGSYAILGRTNRVYLPLMLRQR